MKGKIALFLALPVVAVVAAKLYLHIQVGNAVDSAFAAMAPVAVVEYKTVKSTLDGSIGLSDVVIRPTGMNDAVTVSSIAVKFPSMFYLMNLEKRFAEQDFPEAMRVSMDGVAFDVRGEIVSALEAAMFRNKADVKLAAFDNCVSRTSALPTQQYLLGYDEVSFSIAAGYRFDAHRGQMVTYYEFGQADAVEMKFELGTALSRLSLMGLQNAMSDPELITASLEIRDKGYFARIYDYCAQENKLERAEVTEMLMADFIDYFNDTPMRPDQRILDDYRQFLTGGTEFVMQAKPRQPQKLEYLSLYAPEDVPDLLNIHTIAR